MVTFLVDNVMLCVYFSDAVWYWIGGWVIWFDRISLPTETGQSNNVWAVHWRHWIIPTRKCQIHKSYMKCYIPFIFYMYQNYLCQSITIEARLSEKIQRLTCFPRGNPHDGLYGEAPPERVTVFRIQVYWRLEKSFLCSNEWSTNMTRLKLGQRWLLLRSSIKT